MLLLPVASRPLSRTDAFFQVDGRLGVLVLLLVVVVGVRGPSSGLISRSGGVVAALPP